MAHLGKGWDSGHLRKVGSNYYWGGHLGKQGITAYIEWTGSATSPNGSTWFQSSLYSPCAMRDSDTVWDRAGQIFTFTGINTQTWVSQRYDDDDSMWYIEFGDGAQFPDTKVRWQKTSEFGTYQEIWVKSTWTSNISWVKITAV